VNNYKSDTDSSQRSFSECQLQQQFEEKETTRMDTYRLSTGENREGTTLNGSERSSSTSEHCKCSLVLL